MHIEVKVPGSCGELIQGTQNGVPFLVTCPIDLYTTITVADGPGARQGFGAKAHLALQRTLEYLGAAALPYDMVLTSELPAGKGMASSSADIAAVSLAASAALGRMLTAAEVSRLAASIEPTDGVFFPGIVRLNHITGECQEFLGRFPAMKIAVFDTGGEVDTLVFHQRQDLTRLNKENEQQTMAALALLGDSKEPAVIARAATRSALANQSILPKRDLTEIIDLVLSLGALGINTAHSGTILGVLFAPEAEAGLLTKTAVHLTGAYPHLSYLQSVRLIPGGYFYQQSR